MTSYDTISFLSDYGTVDEFVGVVHSVIHQLAPGTTVIDVSHHVPAHDVRAGGLTLARAAQYLAPGVVLAVVDPGVGTARRAVAIEVGDGGAVFIGPDNGLLAPAVAMVGGATRAESVAAGDAVSARLVLSASVVEPVTAADDVSASVRVAASIAESVESGDEVSARLRVPVLISEIVVPADLVTAPSDSDSSVSDSVVASDRFEVVALRMGRAGRIGGVRRPVLGDARPMQLGGRRPPQRI